MNATDPVLSKLRAALDDIYGARIERVMLYGSRARGDWNEDSDYDVAVFLTDITSRWEEFMRLGRLQTDILIQTGEFVHVMPYAAGAWSDPRSPLMHEIRRDGCDL